MLNMFGCLIDGWTVMGWMNGLSCELMQARNAFCAIRPPGHHAGPTGIVTCANDPVGSHGFCLLSNIAIAAAYAMNAHRHAGKLHDIGCCRARVAIMRTAAQLSCKPCLGDLAASPFHTSHQSLLYAISLCTALRWRCFSSSFSSTFRSSFCSNRARLVLPVCKPVLDLQSRSAQPYVAVTHLSGFSSILMLFSCAYA